MFSSTLISLMTKLVEMALNWASPFFLGKSLEKQKVMEESRELEDKAVVERTKIHRGVVSRPTGVNDRDELRGWTSPDNK